MPGWVMREDPVAREARERAFLEAQARVTQAQYSQSSVQPPQRSDSYASQAQPQARQVQWAHVQSQSQSQSNAHPPAQPPQRSDSYTSETQTQTQAQAQAQWTHDQIEAQAQAHMHANPHLYNGYIDFGRVPPLEPYKNHATGSTSTGHDPQPPVLVRAYDPAPAVAATAVPASAQDWVPPGGWGIPMSLDARFRRLENGLPDEDERTRRRHKRTTGHTSRSHGQGHTRERSAAAAAVSAAPAVMSPNTAAKSLTGGYVALSMHGTSTLRVANLQSNNMGSEILEFLARTVNRFWPPGCMVSSDGVNCVVFKFNGRPWISVGDAGLRARRVLTRLYTVLATRGYAFICSTNTGAVLSSPVQMFKPDTHDSLQTTAVYLSLTVSATKRRITLVDVPPPVGQKLKQIVQYFPLCTFNASPGGHALYEPAVPHDDMDDPLLAQGIVVVSLPATLENVIPRFGVPRPYETNIQNVLSHVQTILSQSGFFLCGSIPMDLPFFSFHRRELILYRSLGQYWGGY